jgi:hypothetical protein
MSCALAMMLVLSAALGQDARWSGGGEDLNCEKARAAATGPGAGVLGRVWVGQGKGGPGGHWSTAPRATKCEAIRRAAEQRGAGGEEKGGPGGHWSTAPRANKCEATRRAAEHGGAGGSTAGQRRGVDRGTGGRKRAGQGASADVGGKGRVLQGAEQGAGGERRRRKGQVKDEQGSGGEMVYCNKELMLYAFRATRAGPAPSWSSSTRWCRCHLHSGRTGGRGLGHSGCTGWSLRSCTVGPGQAAGSAPRRLSGGCGGVEWGLREAAGQAHSGGQLFRTGLGFEGGGRPRGLPAGYCLPWLKDAMEEETGLGNGLRLHCGAGHGQSGACQPGPEVTRAALSRRHQPQMAGATEAEVPKAQWGGTAGTVSTDKGRKRTGTEPDDPGSEPEPGARTCAAIITELTGNQRVLALAATREEVDDCGLARGHGDGAAGEGTEGGTVQKGVCQTAETGDQQEEGGGDRPQHRAQRELGDA